MKKIKKCEVDDFKSKCKQCGHTTTIGVKAIKANAILRIKTFCDYCGERFL